MYQYTIYMYIIFYYKRTRFISIDISDKIKITSAFGSI